MTVCIVVTKDPARSKLREEVFISVLGSRDKTSVKRKLWGWGHCLTSWKINLFYSVQDPRS